MKKTYALVAALALAGLSNLAMAANGPHAFVRGEAGNSEVEAIDADFEGNHYSIRGGYFFNSYVAVEGFYTDFGDDTVGSLTADVTGWGVGLAGKKNLGADNLGFYFNGRVGAVHTETEISSILGSIEDSSTKPYVGMGVGYDFNDNVGLSLNYDHTKAEAFDDSYSIKTLALGLEVRF